MVNILIQWMMVGMLSVMHPFFVSVIDINHNNKEASLEISVRVFSDDLEKTLAAYSKTNIDITKPADKTFVDKQLQAYVAGRLKLSVNGKPVQFTLIGFEQQMESTWCYFEVSGVPVASKVDVTCSLLHDYETNQVNIIHVRSKGVQKTYKLDYPQQKASFSF